MFDCGKSSQLAMQASLSHQLQCLVAQANVFSETAAGIEFAQSTVMRRDINVVDDLQLQQTAR